MYDDSQESESLLDDSLQTDNRERDCQEEAVEGRQNIVSR